MQQDQTPEPLPQADPGAAESAAAPEATPQADTLPSLEELLKAAELKAAEHHDAWLRAKAETENVRRRAAEDVVKAGKFAIEKFA
ncbi:partial Protein GrpE, partial [Rhodocyclaceae bacterium]